MYVEYFKPLSIIPGNNESRVNIVVHNGCTGDWKKTNFFSKRSNLNNKSTLCRNCKIKSRAERPVKFVSKKKKFFSFKNIFLTPFKYYYHYIFVEISQIT